MITKKGDIWRFKNPEFRGLNDNVYFYCKGILDDEIILVRCIIKQDGTILKSNEIDNYKQYEEDLELITLEEFLENKFNFNNNSIVHFNHEKYNEGIIREIDNKNRKLTIEVEGERNYKNIIIDFDDVTIVYPEFSFNDSRKFN